MKLELGKREIELNIEDKNHVILYPSAKRMNRYAMDTRDIIVGKLDKTDYELTEDLMIECGMPKDIVESMYTEDLRAIIRIFDGQKKS